MDKIVDTFEKDDLHYFSREGHAHRVKELLEAGCPINYFDKLGNTPLHYAAEHEHFDVIRLLLDAGADVNAQDLSVAGNTPLGDIAGSCSLDVAKILVDAGADPTITGWMGMSALDRAEKRKKPEGKKVYDFLLKAAKR